jgi:hypothetical protein
MKRAIKFGGKAMGEVTRIWITGFFSGAVLAIAYSRAAQRDEKSGYAFTAAMEWRKAAIVLASFPGAADHCWQQWERIMHLPRRLAGPIGATVVAKSETSHVQPLSGIESVVAGAHFLPLAV